MPRNMKWFLSSAVLSLLTTGFMGCVAAIPLAINYFSTPSEYIATAEVSRSADDVFDMVVKEAENAGSGMKVVQRDDAKRLLAINDGVQTATIKVIGEGGGETQIIVTATKVERDTQKELAVQVLLHLCDRYDKECRVVK